MLTYRRFLFGMISLAWPCSLSATPAAEDFYCIQVVDDATGRGVPR